MYDSVYPFVTNFFGRTLPELNFDICCLLSQDFSHWLHQWWFQLRSMCWIREMIASKVLNTGAVVLLQPRSAAPPHTVSKQCGRGRLWLKTMTAFVRFAKRWFRKPGINFLPMKLRKNWRRFLKALAVWCLSRLSVWNATRLLLNSNSMLISFLLIYSFWFYSLVGWWFCPRIDRNAAVTDESNNGLLCCRAMQQCEVRYCAIRVPNC